MRPFLRKFVVVFLDDILVFSNRWEEHLEHLDTVLSALREQSLFCNVIKCEFALESVRFLGHIREVLQTESGSIFGKVRVKVLAGQGQSTHKYVRTESLFCKQKIDFRYYFLFGQFRWRSDWGHGDVQEDFGGNPVALE